MEQKGSTATEASSDTIGEIFQKRFAPNWKKELHSASL
jgi:hypothetical protein